LPDVDVTQADERCTPGLTAKAMLEGLATIQMVDVWSPTTDTAFM